MGSRRRLVGLLTFATVMLPYGRAHAQVRVLDHEDPELFVDLGGYVQPRFSAQQNDDRDFIDFRPNPAFTVRRARLAVEAGDERWAFARIEVDFAGETAAPLEAYLVFSPLDEEWATLELTAGQQKVPFSRQNLLSSRSHALPDPAYWVSSRFLVERDIGVQLGGEVLKGRGRWYAGVFNGNDPARGQKVNLDPYFLWAGRAEISPLGRPPRSESDLRSLEDRGDPRVTLGFGGMATLQEATAYERRWLGLDLGFWWQGASFYLELFKRCDSATEGGHRLCMPDEGEDLTTPPQISARGVNAQVGYFPHIPWVEEHLELVGRLQWFDPNEDVEEPENAATARELDESDPTWGYVGIVFGLNGYWSLERGNNLKLQASYEIRNETKECLAGQALPGCTGYIDNDLFLLQATAGF